MCNLVNLVNMLNKIMIQTEFSLTPNAQIWPRSLNADIGGKTGTIYLVVADLGAEEDGESTAISWFTMVLNLPHSRLQLHQWLCLPRAILFRFRYVKCYSIHLVAYHGVA